MSFMFYQCSSLKELNLSKFNTNNVLDMSYMFYYCTQLTKLNIFNFKTNNRTNINGILTGCSSLKDLKCSDKNIKKLCKGLVPFKYY